MTDKYQLDTLAVRAGQERSQFGEHAEALYLTSSFVFKNAAQAAARFSGEEEGMVYARFSNPTVAVMQERLAALEGAEGCIATASGMSAILSAVMALLKSGDHVVASRSLFGATQQLLGNILPRFGIDTTFVAGTRPEGFRAAMRPHTKLVFIETPSNPLTEVFDIVALARVAHQGGALLAVDNCFCTPILQRPLQLGADLVIHSATKYLDGQGRVLGGAVCGPKAHTEEVFKFLRTAGPTLSPFNAWVILKGLETLKIRMQAQSANALDLARWLEADPKVERVFYPGLPSHPQHELAMHQQASGGAILSFEVKGGRAEAWRVVDNCKLLSITANLGDTKTTITHPASTTHGRITPEARAEAGIGESLLRIAVGLEAVDDIEADLQRGLASL
jgi:O-succinylhomoserine sulfhydrylase